jgi:hypothetical protein
VIGFAGWLLAWFAGGCVALAAWPLPDWEVVIVADRALRGMADRAIGAGAQVWVWAVNLVRVISGSLSSGCGAHRLR